MTVQNFSTQHNTEQLVYIQVAESWKLGPVSLGLSLRKVINARWRCCVVFCDSGAVCVYSYVSVMDTVTVSDRRGTVGLALKCRFVLQGLSAPMRHLVWAGDVDGVRRATPSGATSWREGRGGGRGRHEPRWRHGRTCCVRAATDWSHDEAACCSQRRGRCWLSACKKSQLHRRVFVARFVGTSWCSFRFWCCTSSSGWRRGVAVECRTCDQKSWVRVSAGHYGVKTLGKFLTYMCLCHQAV